MNRILVVVISSNKTEVSVLRDFLQEQSKGEIAVVGSAGREEEALSRTFGLRPHVIVVNLDSAAKRNLEIIPRLRGLLPDVGIVALLSPADSASGEIARAAGADATVVRTSVGTALVPAIRSAARSVHSRTRVSDQNAPG
jgi:DNA-binding NarL/FixJ family response regulator